MAFKPLNKADKTLLLAALLFALAVALRLAHPASLAAECFLFCAEAALVGGIADWFAVTAIFEKPLGFPYHTAILPRRRESFIEASATMVQQEFFSRRKIFKNIEKLPLLPLLIGWLEAPAMRRRIIDSFMGYAQNYLLMLGSDRQSDVIAAKIRAALLSIEPPQFFAAIGTWLRESGNDREFLRRGAAYLRAQAALPQTRQKLQKLLEDYEEEQTKAQGAFAMLLAGLASAMDLVNIEEAARLIQQQLVAMLDKLADDDSQEQATILALAYDTAAKWGERPELIALARDMRQEIVAALPLAQTIDGTLADLRQQLAAKSEGGHLGGLPLLSAALEETLIAEYGRFLNLLSTDEALRQTIGQVLYDLLARSALQAQAMIGDIVRDVLSRLTDEQLNHLVYDKVEPDLLWIRMNGSIVGAAIGLLLFGIMQLLSRLTLA